VYEEDGDDNDDMMKVGIKIGMGIWFGF